MRTSIGMVVTGEFEGREQGPNPDYPNIANVFSPEALIEDGGFCDEATANMYFNSFPERKLATEVGNTNAVILTKRAEAHGLIGQRVVLKADEILTRLLNPSKRHPSELTNEDEDIAEPDERPEPRDSMELEDYGGLSGTGIVALTPHSSSLLENKAMVAGEFAGFVHRPVDDYNVAEDEGVAWYKPVLYIAVVHSQFADAFGSHVNYAIARIDGEPGITSVSLDHNEETYQARDAIATLGNFDKNGQPMGESLVDKQALDELVGLLRMPYANRFQTENIGKISRIASNLVNSVSDTDPKFSDVEHTMSKLLEACFKTGPLMRFDMKAARAVKKTIVQNVFDDGSFEHNELIMALPHRPIPVSGLIDGVTFDQEIINGSGGITLTTDRRVPYFVVRDAETKNGNKKPLENQQTYLFPLNGVVELVPTGNV